MRSGTDVHTQMGFETWIPEVFPKSRSVLVVDPTWVEEELSSCLSDPISSCLSDPRSNTLSDPRSSSLSEPRSSLGLLVFKIPFTGKQGRKTVYQPKNWSVLLPPANVVCEGYVFTPVCDSVNRGACVVALEGAYMVAGGHAWLLRGGMRGFIQGGVCGFIRGACMVLFRVVCGFIQGACVVLLGGYAWFYSGGMCGFIWGGMHGFIRGACVVFSVFSDTMR